MNTHAIEIELRLRAAAEGSAPTPPKPEDVARFRAELESGGQGGDGRRGRSPRDEEHGPLEVSLSPGDIGAVLGMESSLSRGRPGPDALRPVGATRRAGLGTHLARSRAMQPLVEVLSLVRERLARRGVSELRIVPPEPNPLRLTLHLSMNGNEFVVKAKSALPADRREEVQQALHLLQTSLAARLQMPARVVLMA
jgi:hypothetical protein